MQDQLFIRMLTGDDLLVEAPVPVQWQGRTSRALFALLALHPGEPVSRDRLAGLLWPESDQKAALGSLRMALHSLHGVLDPVAPDLIRAANESIMLDVERQAIDWALFEILCARPDAESRLKALELYRGDLLATFPAPSEAVTELLREKRERLREIAIETGLVLITTFEGTGEQDQIRSIVHKILSIEPANEPAHRTMMRAHATAGDKAAALRQYEQCCEALKEQYEVGPSVETIALRNEIVEEQAREPPKPDEQNGESASDEAVLVVPPSRQCKRPVWRRFAPAAFAFVMLALVLAAILSGGIKFNGDEDTAATVIVLLLNFDKADQIAAQTVNEIRDAFEKTLRQIPGTTVITAPSGNPPKLQVDHFLVDATIIQSDNRLRIFVKLRCIGSIVPLWQDRQDFEIRAYERLAGWIETGLMPALRSETSLDGSSDCRVRI